MSTLISGPRPPRGNELKRLQEIKDFVKADLKKEFLALAAKMDQDSGVTGTNYGAFVEAIFATEENEEVALP